jgi:hypothetical protein
MKRNLPDLGHVKRSMREIEMIGPIVWSKLSGVCFSR